jgi:signal transduction histidine kinase
LSRYLSLIEHGRPEKQQHYRTVLKKQVSRLEQLVEDILNLSRLARQLEEATFVPVDLNGVVAVVVNAQLPHAQAADLSLTFVPYPDLPPVRGDRDRLMQVATNLVTNAIKYTLEGNVEVKTGLVSTRSQAYLSVTDSGIGISAEDLPHLFERFYRGKHTAYLDVPGTGLGLSIINEIVGFHGGKVEVESQEGEGSTFKVLLPLAEGTDRVPAS